MDQSVDNLLKVKIGIKHFTFHQLPSKLISQDSHRRVNFYGVKVKL